MGNRPEARLSAADQGERTALCERCVTEWGGSLDIVTDQMLTGCRAALDRPAGGGTTVPPMTTSMTMPRAQRLRADGMGRMRMR